MSDRKSQIIDYTIELYSRRGLRGLEEEVERTSWEKRDRDFLEKIKNYLIKKSMAGEFAELWSLTDPRYKTIFNSFNY